MAVGSDYQQLLAAIQSYYGAGSNEWLAFAQYGLTADNAAAILKQVPGVSTQITKDGKILSYALDTNIALNDGGTALSVINSNVQSGTAAAANTMTTRTVGTMVKDAQTGEVTMTSQIPKKIGGSVTTAPAASVSLSNVICAASVGFGAGRLINSALSHSDPDFWGRVIESPREGSVSWFWWKQITDAVDKVDPDGKIQNFINGLVGWDSSGKTQTYISEDAYAYYMAMLAEEGMFNDDAFTDGTGNVPAAQGGGTYPINVFNTFYTYVNQEANKCVYVCDEPMMGVVATGTSQYGGYSGRIIAMAKVDVDTTPKNRFTYHVFNGSGSLVDRPWFSDDARLGLGHYRHSMNYSATAQGKRIYYERMVYFTNDVTSNYSRETVDGWNFPKTLNTFPEQQSTVPGVDTQPGATLPDTTGWFNPSTGDPDPQAIKQSIESQYPDLFDNAYEITTIDENGDEQTIRYVPIPIPEDYDDNNSPTGGETSTQQDPEVDPSNATDDMLKTIIDLLTLLRVTPESVTETDPDSETDDGDQTTDPNPPDTGDGTTPPVVVPTGTASALWSVYNPTQQDINDLGAWLWSNNFVTQLLQMFNDPMQAIIGLHKTFITPSVGAAQNIKVGYLDSGISSLTVPTQYSTMNCGSVNLAEYFGNVFDYTPYTRVYIYLPFIGFRELDVSQVMRSSIGVVYHGDAYTGACLAEVSVTRDGGAGGVLYTYGGECAVRYPLSHGSYMGIVNAIATLGVGVAGAALGAGGLGIMGGLSAFQNARLSVEHSGSFDGCSGAMGIKKPYLVVMRPQTAMPTNYKHFSGRPSSSLVQIADTSGLIRVRECHVDEVPNATKEEKDMIDKALHDGILVG